MSAAPTSVEDFERTFSGLLLQAFHHSKPPEVTRQEADYIAGLLKCGVSARLLDVPCGSGRIGLALAARGYRVTGVDISPDLVAEAQQEAQQRHLDRVFMAQQGDMRDLPWTGEFDGALCFWESFGYLGDTGNRDFLAAVAQTLKPGARFVMDTHVAESYLPRLPNRSWVDGDGLWVLEENTYDHTSGLVRRHWHLLREGQAEQRTLNMNLYTYRELVALLQAAGFAECQGYAFMTGEPFGLGARRLVMVATRAQETSAEA